MPQEQESMVDIGEVPIVVQNEKPLIEEVKYQKMEICARREAIERISTNIEFPEDTQRCRDCNVVVYVPFMCRACNEVMCTSCFVKAKDMDAARAGGLVEGGVHCENGGYCDITYFKTVQARIDAQKVNCLKCLHDVEFPSIFSHMNDCICENTGSEDRNAVQRTEDAYKCVRSICESTFYPTNQASSSQSRPAAARVANPHGRHAHLTKLAFIKQIKGEQWGGGITAETQRAMLEAFPQLAEEEMEELIEETEGILPRSFLDRQVGTPASQLRP